MLSFTKPTSDQDGEETPVTETTAETAEAGPAADAASPEVNPLFAKAEKAPTPVEAAYEPAVRSQIQRVRLDLLSRETERLEQQLRQVLDQQNEDRQLREELRGQISALNQRIEGLLAGGASKSAASGGTDGDLRSSVKPLLEAVMQMLDSADAAGLSEASPAAQSSEAWAQVDAARRAPPPETQPVAAEVPVEPAPEATPAPEAEAADATGEVVEPEPAESPEPELTEAEPALPPLLAPEEDLDPDPEAELRIEIARLLRPKKAGGGYEPLSRQVSPRAQRAEAEVAPPPSSLSAEPAEAESQAPCSPQVATPETEPRPLLLGTEETPAIVSDPASESEATVTPPADAVEPVPEQPQASGLDSIGDDFDGSPDQPKADPAQSELRGGGAVPKSHRPSWAPRPNPMRASLPKCLTEPWEEPSQRPGKRWPFRRARPAGGRNDPTE